MTIIAAFNLPFEEQIAFFRQKTNLPSAAWDSIWKDAHDRAFIVAGATKAELVNDFRLAIDQAISQGKSIGWFRKEFDAIVQKHGWTGWTGEGSKAGRDWRTRVIYRTNLSSSYAAGRWQQLTDPDLLAVRPYWKYIHSDTVTHPRKTHESWNGIVLRYDDPWWKTHFTPNGWNCFTPETLVTGDFEIGLKSFHSGKIFKLTTRSGAYFTVTANHPILSQYGWVEAKTLKKGDNLLRYTGIVNADAPMIINNQQPPSTAKDWFESLACDAFGICKIASFDFHGDTKFRKGDVYVAGAECVLMDNFKALPLEQLEQGDFKWTDNSGIEHKTTTYRTSICRIARKNVVSFDNRFNGWSGVSSLVDYLSRTQSRFVQLNDLFFKFIIPSIRSLPSRLTLSFNRFWIKFSCLPFQCFSLAHGASIHASLIQRVSNHTSANQVSFCKRLFTFTSKISRCNFTIIQSYFFKITPRQSFCFYKFFKRIPLNTVAFTDFLERYHGQVVIDDIVGIEDSFYSGHVYTFQSKNEIIIANGIITHNCQCRIKAVRPSEYNGKPAPDDGFETKIVNGKAYTVPKGIDVGWDYAPGANVAKTLTQLVEDKAISYPPAIRRALQEDFRQTTPVSKLSSFVSIPPATDPCQGAVINVLQRIDAVHQVPFLPTIKVKTAFDRKNQGTYNVDNPVILLSHLATQPELALTHELGHLLDYEAIGVLGVLAAEKHPLFYEWRTAVAQSNATLTLRALFDKTKDEQILNYWLRLDEQWARSYAQYIAIKTKDAALLTQVKQYLDSSDETFRYAQWQYDEFLPILTATDNLFTLLGWKAHGH